MKYSPFVLLLAASLALSGCAGLGMNSSALAVQTGAAGTKPKTRPLVARPMPARPRSPEDFDVTTVEERKAAVTARPLPEAKRLGSTVASLGNPAEQGFWMKTPLVRTATRGRIVYPVTGTSVEVDLFPLDGPATGGSQVSLAAMRLLGAPLTALPELVVYGQ